MVVSPADEDATDPALGVDANGTATIIYVHGAAKRLAAREGSGSTWSPQADVSDAGVTAQFPTIAVNSSGAAVVSWLQAGAQTFASLRSGAGQPFGAGRQVSAATKGVNGSRTGIDDAGDVLVTWSQQEPAATDAGPISMRASYRPVGGSFDPVAPAISSTTVGVINSSLWQVRFRPDGSATVIYDYNTDNHYAGANTVQYADRSPGATGTWSPPTNAEIAPPQAYSPAIGIDSTGAILGTWWTSFSGNNATLVTATRPLGATFGSTTTIATARARRRDSAAVDNPLSVAPNGFAVQLWQGTSNGNTAIFSAIRNPGGAFTEITPFSIGDASASPHRDEWSPAVATDDQGNAAAAWVQQTGTTFTLETELLDNAPPVITAVSVPASVGVNGAAAMGVAASDRVGPIGIHFDFGDGAGADGANVSHAYASPGAYTVTVTVTDAAGNKATQTRALLVTAPIDADGDGVSPPADCNDNDAKIHPGAIEVVGQPGRRELRRADRAIPASRCDGETDLVQARQRRDASEDAEGGQRRQGRDDQAFVPRPRLPQAREEESQDQEHQVRFSHQADQGHDAETQGGDHSPDHARRVRRPRLHLHDGQEEEPEEDDPLPGSGSEVAIEVLRRSAHLKEDRRHPRKMLVFLTWR